MRSRLTVFLATAAFLFVAWRMSGAHRPPLPGRAAADPPVQTDLVEGEAEFWPVATVYRARALAHYHVHARVLGVERYRFDPCAPIAPVDLALSWGRLSDPALYRQLDVSQGGRFYTYQWGAAGPPLPLPEIITHSANNHIIPADERVAASLRRVVRDDVVILDGSLVEVTGPSGFVWRSSLTRDDTGGGACELFRVTNLVIEPR